MAELPDTDQSGAAPALGSLDAELARTDSPSRWLRGPVVRGGSLRAGVLTGFVASFIPTALFFNGGGMPRTAILVGILLLLIAGMAAVPPSRRRTGIGAIAGLLVGAVLTGVVARTRGVAASTSSTSVWWCRWLSRARSGRVETTGSSGQPATCVQAAMFACSTLVKIGLARLFAGR